MKAREIEISKILGPLFEIRLDSGAEKLAELTESIRQHGVIEPITVTPREEGLFIVCGARRWRAARMAGLKKIPAVVRELSDEDALAVSVTENIQRHDMSAWEEALAFRMLMENNGWTQERCAEKLGLGRDYIAKRMRLFHLDEKTIKDVDSGDVSLSVALELARVDDEPTRDLYREQAKKYGSNVQTVRYWVDGYLRDQEWAKARPEEAEEAGPVVLPQEPELPCFMCGDYKPYSKLFGISICDDCYTLLRQIVEEMKRQQS